VPGRPLSPLHGWNLQAYGYTVYTVGTQVKQTAILSVIVATVFGLR